MSSNSQHHSKEKLAGLALGAIGVVFGDIGTSPLYAMKEVFHGGLTIDKIHVLGVLSLIFWAITMVVTIKYAVFIMRADNKGEGGIIALMALALHGSKDKPKKMALHCHYRLIGRVVIFRRQHHYAGHIGTKCGRRLADYRAAIGPLYIADYHHGAGRVVYPASERHRQGGQNLFAGHVFLVWVACGPGRDQYHS